ncbi:MAG: DUF5522 domain-containing protein [Bacteroidetes bacterium]|nr:DUF5522 domain-containing protein [Bacteroidota bacterium]
MSFTAKFEKEDFYLNDEGYVIFTEAYHLKRGYCCQSNCLHCPYKEKPDKKERNRDIPDSGNQL